ncbi:MAG: GNAT family acetyltransferase [Dehalococcoidales bacterium]|nr:MAG: GNAT family acetyltransferase [Dehalococcoidales bacterium]
MDEMILRQYSSGDEEAVINLWQACNLIKPWNNPHQDINRKLKDSPELFLVGTINGIIVASVMAGYDGHRGWIYYLAVDPGYRKQGLGRQIMSVAEEKLLELGCPKIDLMVRRNNPDVFKFYEKIGYGHDEVITMSRRLIEDEPYNG